MKKQLESSIKTLIVAFITSEMTFYKKEGETDANIDNTIEESGELLYEEIVDQFKAQIPMVTLVGDSCTINIPNNLVYDSDTLKMALNAHMFSSTPTYTLLDIVALS